MASLIELRAADDGDRDLFLRFMRGSAGDDKAEMMARRWDWQWRRDPRLDEPGFRGVLAVWDGQIIANTTLMPAGLYVDGNPVPATWLVDVRVHRPLLKQALRAMARAGERKAERFPRGLAAALFDHPAAGARVLGKHINEDMVTIGYRVGFVDMPFSGNFQRRVSLRYPLQKALGAAPGAWLAPLADLGFGWFPRPRLEVEPLDGAFDERFDALWRRALAERRAITRRDAAVLQWHYREHPDTDYRVRLIRSRDGLRAYLVYKIWLRKERRVARIVDLLAGLADLEAVEALLRATLRECRREGVERLDWFVSSEELNGVLPRLGFRARPMGSGRPQTLMARGIEPLSIYVTAGDGDGG